MANYIYDNFRGNEIEQKLLFKLHPTLIGIYLNDKDQFYTYSGLGDKNTRAAPAYFLTGVSEKLAIMFALHGIKLFKVADNAHVCKEYSITRYSVQTTYIYYPMLHSKEVLDWILAIS